ncbi:MAG: polysaccharide biosynthesis tyrosine autokinase [Candidatus Schekmanbacteria bacterium]|nr:polysaccharide biosynthesis tyrosine autokinase [Candidatus Schekmanbacteria bacterium]
MEFLKIWELLIRRKKTIYLTFFSVFTTIFIGTLMAKPVYEAKAKILIEKSSDSLSSLMSLLGLKSAGRMPNPTEEESYDTEIALAKIRPLLGELISNLNLRDRDNDKLEPEDLIKSSVLRKLFPQPYMEVEQYEETDMLEITANSTSPAEAAKMSNELARLYIEDRLEQKRTEYKSARIFMENQLKDVKEKYVNSLLQKKDFMLKAGVIDLPTEIKNLLDNISALKNEYRRSEIAIAQADENIKLIEKKIGGKEYISSTQADQLKSKLNDLIVTIAGKSGEFTEENPDIAQLNRQMEAVRKLLRDNTDIVFGKEEVSVVPVQEDLIKELKDAYINKKLEEIKTNTLKQHIDKFQDALIKIPLISMENSEIEHSLTVYKEVYQKLLGYLTQVGLAESMTLSDVKLVEPATAPDSDKPIFPKKKLNFLLGIFFGLFWGLVLAFFLEYIDNTIKGAEDLKDSPFVFLGSIPMALKSPLVSSVDPNDPLYESYRAVISGLHFAGMDKPFNKLLLNGLVPKAGNSTTLVNLGIMYAKENKKVLLIDTDLRRPSLHQFFNLSNREGITSLLLEAATAEKTIQPTGIENLSVLASGPTPPDTGSLIKSNKMRELIDKLEVMYDLLIFDSAPLLIKNDAVLLMNCLGNMIIVLKSETTPRQAISRANEILKNANFSPLGNILIKSRKNNVS